MSIVKTAVVMVAIAGAVSASAQTAYDNLELAPTGDGGRIEFHQSGNPTGEAVLFIHGAGVAAAFFPIMDEPALAEYHLIRIHRRGFAGSSDPSCPYTPEDEALDALAVLDQLSVSKAHVVGHSAGGAPAANLAAIAPERVQTLVLQEGYPMVETWNLPPGVRAGYEKTVECPPTELAQTPQSAEEGLTLMFGDDWETEAENLIPGIIEQSAMDFPRQARVLAQLEQSFVDKAFYTGIKQPVLAVFSGPESFVLFRQQSLERLPSLLADFDYVDVEGVDHFMQMKWPTVMAETLAEWFQKHPIESDN